MNKKKPAFTLLELIIAMAITITVLVIAGSMFTTGNKVFSDSDVKSTLQLEGQVIQEKISDIGMQGSEVVSASSDEQSGEVDVIIKSYIKSDDIPRYFKIQKSDKNLIINEDTDKNCSDSDNDQIISENVDALKVDGSNPNSLKFDITLTKKKGYSDVSQTIAFTINFRNKGN